MGKYLKLLLELLAAFFGWQKNKTDPEHEFQQKHEAWETELRRLENATKAAISKRENYVATTPAGSFNDDTYVWLYSAAAEAANAERSHRTREPQRNGD